MSKEPQEKLEVDSGNANAARENAPAVVPDSAAGSVKKMQWFALIGGLVAAIVVVGVVKNYRDLNRQEQEYERTPQRAPSGAAAPARRQPQAVVPSAERPRAPHANPEAGDVLEGVVTGVGSRGDGRINVRGRTVYVPGVQKGETVRFRVLRDTGNVLMAERVENTVPLTELLPEVAVASPAAAAAADAATSPPSPSALPAAAATSAPHAVPAVGDVLEGTVNGVGKQGDGRIRLRGKTIYVPGTKEGETVRFRIVRPAGAAFVGQLVDASVPLTELLPEAPSAARAGSGGIADDAGQTLAAVEPAVVAPVGDLPEGVLDGATSKADAVQQGTEFSVVITDKDRFNPDKNGVCRIGGFVVIVADAQPGPERVRIKITERLERRANAELVK